MMKVFYKTIINKLFFILIPTVSFSITDVDLSDRIVIDGVSDDFTIDEKILLDSAGNLLEYPSDSYWGEYNDVKQIKVTWDELYLYLAVDACSWDNNVLVFLDLYDDYGIEDMSELNAWQRSFKFYNYNPDFFIGTWDTNDTPQFWKVQDGGTMQVEQISTIETSASFNTGNLSGSMEIKIPWSALNFGYRTINSIKLSSVVTTGDDFSSGPDSAPDNLGGMTNDPAQMVVLDNYAEVLIDEDQDGNPDMGVEPQIQTSFYKDPPFAPVPLLIDNVIFQKGKTFSPLLDQYIYFELETNRVSDFDVKVFNLNGKFMSFAEQDEDPLHWKWNGRDEGGSLVPFGIYILYFIADSGEVSHKEAIILIK